VPDLPFPSIWYLLPGELVSACFRFPQQFSQVEAPVSTCDQVITHSLHWQSDFWSFAAFRHRNLPFCCSTASPNPDRSIVEEAAPRHATREEKPLKLREHQPPSRAPSLFLPAESDLPLARFLPGSFFF